MAISKQTIKCAPEIDSRGQRVTDHDALDDWLAAGAGGGAPCDRLIETPISKVYLFADRAYKRKKPVDFGFLDFTTLAKRKWASERELRLNRLTAPDVYRCLHGVVGGKDGFHLAPFETRGAVDYVLEMRRFDETAVLSECPERVDGDLAEAIGREIARFHAGAAAGKVGGGADGLEYVLNSNAQHLRQLATLLGGDEASRVILRTADAFDDQADLLDLRLEQGFVRVCHGDLHLGNILLENGHALLFDRIEFNDRLIEIDVLYDLAFTLMDLAFRGRTSAANRALNGWLDEAARHFPVEPLYRGLAALPLFQSVRAAVRSHVSGHNGDLEAARAYLKAANGHLDADIPQLIAIGGLSGSGKSTLARAVAPKLGLAPGAVILRSDEFRKRLYGVGPTQHLPPDAYTPEADAQIHDAMFTAARKVLKSRTSVILDATFRDAERRRQVLDLHSSARGFWLDAPDPILRERVATRQNDASDADVAVLDRQLAHRSAVTDWTVVDATDALTEQVSRILADDEVS
jgi:hypothetical protein